MNLSRFLFILFCIAKLSFYSSAQDTTQTKKKEEENPVYALVQDEPKFVRGDDTGEKLMEYLQSKLVYPKKAKKNGIQGRVYVQFVVDLDGSVRDVTIVKGIPELNQAALDTFIGIPKFEHVASANGRPVAFRKVVYINFKLD